MLSALFENFSETVPLLTKRVKDDFKCIDLEI
jgi:hypothetical protein